MRVFVDSMGMIEIDEISDHVRDGGQARVFAQGDIAFKVMHNRKNLISESKLNELAALSNPDIIKPAEYIAQSKLGQRIGFTMRYVNGYVTLMKLFSNGFWKRSHFNQTHALKLYERIIEIVRHAVSKQCLPVDPNPLNFLVKDRDFGIHVMIDVDAWQTKNHKATAVAPGVRDFLSNEFSEQTVWYGIAVIGCQLFLGVHPYLDGEHQKYGNDLEQRAKNHASIFSDTVRKTLNTNTRDFGIVPANLMDWFVRTFEKGERTSPPDQMQTQPRKHKRSVVTASDLLHVTLLREYKYDIMSHRFIGGHRMIRCAEGMYIDDAFHPGFMDADFVDDEFVLFKDESNAISLWLNGNEHMRVANATILPGDYVKILTDDGTILSPVIIKLGVARLTLKRLFLFIPKHTIAIDGALVMRAFAGDFICLAMHDAVIVRQINALKGFHVIDGIARGHCVNLVVSQHGTQSAMLVVFNTDFSRHEVYHIGNEPELSTSGRLAFTCGKGFLAVLDTHTGDNRIYKDKFFDADTSISSENGLVAFKGNKLFKVSTKS